jgi:hypothetical protein
MQPEDIFLDALQGNSSGNSSGLVSEPDVHQYAGQHDQPQQHPTATCDSQRPQTPLPSLREIHTLQVICRSTGKIVWSKMKCLVGLENGTDCCIQMKETKTKQILCEDSIMTLQVPKLRCMEHDRVFTVTQDPKLWAHVERMQQAGEVFIHPHIVVLSQKVRLTMRAYRCAKEYLFISASSKSNDWI